MIYSLFFIHQVDHEELVNYVQEYFVNVPSAWSEDNIDTSKSPDSSVAKYTGGIVTVSIILSNIGIFCLKW